MGLTNQQNVLYSSSQDVLHGKAFSWGMHSHGALVPALLLWPRALPRGGLPLKTRASTDVIGVIQKTRAGDTVSSGGCPFPCLWRCSCRAKAGCKGRAQMRHDNSLC